jgi:CubicO group peptidase (beta-lactamase class C family)
VWRGIAAATTGLALLALIIGLLVARRAGAPHEEPHELMVGGHEPPAPRVAPELESLEGGALEAAAHYAAAHDSQALIVARHDHIVFERYWRGTSFDTPADAQDFTPLLAALATGAALSHRRLGWPDEPLAALLAEWARDPRGAITLRNLLQSSSGLTRAAGAPEGGADIVAAALAAVLTGTPGATRREQAVDPQLLALVLERATHERYAAWVSETLWRRLGAADAWLRLDRPGGAAHADCCLLAHQGDWIRVGELLLGDGNYRGSELMRPGWVMLLRAPARADARYGSFVRLASSAARAGEPYAAPDLFLVGNSGGNRMWLVPSLRLAIVRIAAGTDAAWQDTRIPNLIVRGARDYLPPAAQPGADVTTLVPAHQP